MEPQHPSVTPATLGARHRRPRRRLLTIGLAAALAFGSGGLVAVNGATASETSAQSDVGAQQTYWRGPNPTVSSIEALRGSYSTSTTNVSSFVSGFGGGTIYYPTSTSDGTFGGVVIAPGFTASESSMSWYGHRLASQGFVVFTIDTNSRYDQPNSRATQMLSALDYLTDRSSERHRVDDSRLAVMGHSMGGGGTLRAAQLRPALKAAIPLTAWHTTKSWNISVPTMIVGAESDSVASVRSHSIPFYNSLPSGTDKTYLELDNASHFAPNSSNTTIAKYSISWLKRFVDDDTRYDQFLCPLPSDRSLSDVRGSCPH